jgi:cyclic pyranopterin phosphate synthase
MLDRYNREINYLRVSVTDRCNLRCVYCMPAEGIKLLEHKDIISYEEILEVVRTAVSLGIKKVRITGGEPLVRKGVVHLVDEIAKTEGIKDFGLTTNGQLLDTFAEPLAKAGLHRINISLDTTDPETYREITRGGDIRNVFKGIGASKNAGLQPIKINCVVKHSSHEKNAQGVKDYCDQHGLEVRYIHEMDLETGCFSKVENGSGGDCKKCTRLRLTANGLVKPCLFSNQGFSIRKLGIRVALELAIGLKPEKGTINENDKFHFLGG